MPIFTPNKPTRKRPMFGKPTRPNKQIEAKARALLTSIADRLKVDVQGLAEFYEQPRPMFDALSDMLTRYDAALSTEAIEIADKWTTSVSEAEKAKLTESIGRALGVDVTHVLDSPEIAKAVADAQFMAQVEIKTIPVKLIDSVSKAVLDNFQGRPMPEGRSLTDQIQHICGNARYRARLIARDQTSKMTTALTKARQESVGISMYVWRTAKDIRVVGTPGGEYKPTPQHGNHYKMDGMYCRWDDPTVYSDDKGKTWKPRTGDMPTTHPGQDINCRCVSIAVIDPATLIM